MATSTLRWLVGFGVALAGLTGCVAPGEFDAVTQDCDGQRFDAPTRDDFCSGSWKRTTMALDVEGAPLEGVRAIHVFSPSAGSAYGERLVAVSTVRRGGQGRVELYGGADTGDDGLPSPRLLRTMILPDGDDPQGDDQQLAILGGVVQADGSGTEPIISSALLEGGSLRFVEGLAEPGAGGQGFGRAFSQSISDPVQAIAAGAGTSRACSNGGGPDGTGLAFASVHALQTDEARDRRLGLVAMRCGLAVYGMGAALDSAQVLMELPLSAVDINVDGEGDRLYVAAGADGLKVRSLSSFKRQVFDQYDAIWPEGGEVETDTWAPECGTPDCANGGVLGDAPGGAREVPEPLFDHDPGLQASDPGEFAHINVTRVGFSGDRVMYVNGAIGAGGDDGATLLVAGRLTAANTLAERTTVKVADDDTAVGVVHWSLEPVGASHFAVYRQVTGSDGAPDGERSWLAIYDAPDGQQPTRVFDLPIDAPPVSIASLDGDLYVAYSDRIDIYRITIAGEPVLKQVSRD